MVLSLSKLWHVGNHLFLYAADIMFLVSIFLYKNFKLNKSFSYSHVLPSSPYFVFFHQNTYYIPLLRGAPSGLLPTCLAHMISLLSHPGLLSLVVTQNIHLRILISATYSYCSCFFFFANTLLHIRQHV